MSFEQVDVTLALSVVFLGGLLAAGVVERWRHHRNVDAISLRINVNGSRGKSTVTRLINGMLVDAGYQSAAKTTGTEARLIFGHSREEREIKRRPEGPNIREQKIVMREVARSGANAMVSECMAIVPEYQEIFQNQLLRANITVICNVLEDHLKEMGPTTDEVAEAYAETVPFDGTLVLAKGPYLDYLTEVAESRGSRVVVADNSRVAESDLAAFDFLVFPDHVALTLAVADALDIEEEVALAGMKKAGPDPFATHIRRLPEDGFFVSAFAANDPASTLGIWQHLLDQGHTDEGLVVVMNCRADRWERSEQFATDVLPKLPATTLVLIGQLAAPVLRAHEAGTIKVPEMLNLEGHEPADVFDTVRGLLDEGPSGQVVFGVGNLHHAAIPLIEAFEARALNGSAHAHDSLVPEPNPEVVPDVRN